MNEVLNEIRARSAGLFYLSESDHPFELFHWNLNPGSLAEKIIEESGKPADSLVEKVSLDHFFRNMVKLEDAEMAKSFIDLKNVLEKNLSNITVYRVGHIQVEVFIVGQLQDGSYAGLRTISIET